MRRIEALTGQAALDHVRAEEERLRQAAGLLGGTAAEVAPVQAIEDRVYGDNPVTRELAALYARVVRGEAETGRG
ncbi:hypothetical protein, partial [Acinetobacter variabilis]|uniref:hypothetical protein n=1 Tax=Acinetobacter variabilis TaxID=70346 RepID=UPI0030F93AAD